MAGTLGSPFGPGALQLSLGPHNIRHVAESQAVNQAASFSVLL